ncbi:MAG: hypothetical protein P1U46_04180 [Patescibacteria group bacterium]|nr:hypothetical protein [Patescibacteria group bacterium]
MLNFIFSFQPYILVFKSRFILYSKSSHFDSLLLVLFHPQKPPPKKDSNISHKSTSTHQPLNHPPKGLEFQEVLPYISY